MSTTTSETTGPDRALTEATPSMVEAALGAAFLNAAFAYCLGCEMYQLLKRAATRPQPA